MTPDDGYRPLTTYHRDPQLTEEAKQAEEERQGADNDAQQDQQDGESADE